MLKNGLFIISLDFELMWGVRDKRSISSYGNNISGVRQVIPNLLQLFSQYNINATFATVGFLFARNKKELIANLPKEIPDYSASKYSPYDYISTIGESEEEDMYHYAYSLILLIKKYPQQEIASHTFSHYYCLEGASLTSFEADLEAAKKIAALYSVDLKTIVFPRNQYSKEHLEICKKTGFIAFRGNEASTFYHPRSNEEQSKIIRGTKLADSYLNITGHHTFKEIKVDTLINIPASRFLRPYSKKLHLADFIRLKRIKDSMSYAARNQEGYHLWWHPHNFGINLQQNLNILEEILKHYELLSKKYGMESKTMKTIAEENLQLHGL
ncbi:MAG: polysaccharide deacetylase family protein [Flavisolibacter sp.]|nr:polysaccharide deacetylase family protein [Flavisolibacter sp.]